MAGALNIPPVREFQYDRPIFYIKWVWQIVVSVDDKQIRSRLEPPLKAGIQIDVFDLLIVLDKGREEQRVCHRHIYSWPHQPKICGAPRF